MNGDELYQLRLQHTFDMERALEQALGREDEYKDVVRRLLMANGVPPAVIDSEYSGWGAFCGGGAEMLEVLQRASELVAKAAAQTPADVPTFFCGLWPMLDVNASSRRVGDGAVVYVHYGLLLGLRVLTQCVAQSFGDIVTGEHTVRSDQASAEFARYCAKYLSRTDVQKESTVAVLPGPPEVLRRQLMLGAVLYTIAHEAGHLARCRPFRGGWKDDNQDFRTSVDDPYTLPPPDTEVEVARASSSETIADLIAAHVLRTAPCTSGDQPPLWLVLGAMCVPLLQSALWWRTAALTDRPLGWSHPFPDLRLVQFSSLFPLPQPDYDRLVALTPQAERDKTETEIVASRFYDWANHVLAIEVAKERVRQVGLADRGIDPLSLMSLYATDPRMPQLPSDVVAATRATETSHPT